MGVHGPPDGAQQRPFESGASSAHDLDEHNLRARKTAPNVDATQNLKEEDAKKDTEVSWGKTPDGTGMAQTLDPLHLFSAPRV
jgi:hypothetical protein